MSSILRFGFASLSTGSQTSDPDHPELVEGHERILKIKSILYA